MSNPRNTPEPSEQAIEELAYKISGLTLGVPGLSPPASRLREIAGAWLRAAYAVDRGVSPPSPDLGLIVQEKFDVAARCDNLAAQFEDGKSPQHKLTIAGLLRSAARLLRVRGARGADPEGEQK